MRLLTTTLLLAAALAHIQAQTISGVLVDAQSELPLIGATVELISVPDVAGTTTDIDGAFRIDGVPVGRHELRLSYVGYEPQAVPNVVVTAGRDTRLELSLEESFAELGTAVVTARVDPAATVNELSEVSTRSFSAEQVNRFAGGRSDVGRLANNYAGVSTADDSSASKP